MKKLKVLCELGQVENRALLLELPKEAIQELDIAKDGTVQTEAFLTLISQYYGNEEAAQQEVAQYEPLMSAIFDPSLAVEAHPLRRK